MLKWEVKYWLSNKRALIKSWIKKGTDNQPNQYITKTTEFFPVEMKSQSRQVCEVRLIPFFTRCFNPFTSPIFYDIWKLLIMWDCLSRRDWGLDTKNHQTSYHPHQMIISPPRLQNLHNFSSPVTIICNNVVCTSLEVTAKKSRISHKTYADSSGVLPWRFNKKAWSS